MATPYRQQIKRYPLLWVQNILHSYNHRNNNFWHKWNQTKNKFTGTIQSCSCRINVSGNFDILLTVWNDQKDVMLLGSEQELCMSTLFFVYCSKHTAHTQICICVYIYIYAQAKIWKVPRACRYKIAFAAASFGVLLFVCFLNLNTSLSTTLDTNSNVI